MDAILSTWFPEREDVTAPLPISSSMDTLDGSHEGTPVSDPQPPNPIGLVLRDQTSGDHLPATISASADPPMATTPTSKSQEGSSDVGRSSRRLTRDSSRSQPTDLNPPLDGTLQNIPPMAPASSSYRYHLRSRPPIPVVADVSSDSEPLVVGRATAPSRVPLARVCSSSSESLAMNPQPSSSPTPSAHSAPPLPPPTETPTRPLSTQELNGTIGAIIPWRPLVDWSRPLHPTSSPTAPTTPAAGPATNSGTSHSPPLPTGPANRDTAGPSRSNHPLRQPSGVSSGGPPNDSFGSLPVGATSTSDFQLLLNNLNAIATVFVRTRTAARQLEATRLSSATRVTELESRIRDLTGQVDILTHRLQVSEAAHEAVLLENTNLRTSVTALQGQLADTAVRHSRPEPSLRRLELEQQLSTRLRQADLLMLDNQRLTLQLATLTLPPRELSRAIRDYAVTKQQDLDTALTAHREDYARQQRWLQRFEERDPTFEPWLEDDETTCAEPTSTSPTV